MSDPRFVQQAPSIKRGQTFTAVLDVLAGDPAGVTVTGDVKVARNGKSPGDEIDPVASYDIVFVEHLDADDPASAPGWIATLTPAQTLSLTAGGNVVSDFRFERDGHVDVTQTFSHTVVERVTEKPNG